MSLNLPIWQATIQDSAGNLVDTPSIEVRTEAAGTALVPLYSDRTGATPISNPFPAGSDGFAQFYVLPGEYKITASKGSFSRTWRYVVVDRTPVKRIRLEADLVIHVNIDDGDDDSGDGLSTDTPYQTLQKACEQAVNLYDKNGYNIFVQMDVPGTYGGVFLTGQHTGTGSLAITAPDDTDIDGYIIEGDTLDGIRTDYCQVGVRWCTVQSADQSGLNAIGMGKIDMIGEMRFGTCGFGHVSAVLGGFIHLAANYTIAGGALFHLGGGSNSIVRDDATTISFVGNPSIPIWASFAENSIAMLAGPLGTGIALSGTHSAVGYRFVVDSNAIIFTNNTNWLPGALAGIKQAGGRYDGVTTLAVTDFPSTLLDVDGTLAANSDVRIASQKAVKTYVDQIVAANDAMVFKGVIDCSANPNYPAADRGWTYRVSVAGKIGGSSGIVVEAGDLIMCLDDGTSSGTQAAQGSHWTVTQTNIDGAVVGPASATDSNFAQFDGTTGKLIKGGLAFDTDGTLAANSASRVPAQSAVKTYADTKIASSFLDTDTALAANSDSKIATQKATKAYADLKIPLTYLDTDTGLAANSDTKIATQKATKAYADTKIAGPGTVTSLDFLRFNGTTGLAVQGGISLDTDGTLAANSDTRLASQKAVKTYVDQIIAAQDAMVFKGVIDASSNPNYPAADRGHTYRISVAGKIGGASGTNVEAGDTIICLDDSTSAGTQAAQGSHWGIIQTNIDGAVIGPSSATDGHFAQFDGATGKLLKGGISLDTDGALTANSDTVVASQKAIKTYAQPKDATLTALAALVTAANKLIYADGVDSFQQTDLTSVARTLIGQTTQALMRTTGLGLQSSGFHAHKNGTNQTGITSATPTKITFGTELFDKNGDFASSTWTPPAGLVHISVTALLSNSNGLTYLMIYKNGAAFKQMYNLGADAFGNHNLNVNTFDNANGTDTYEAYCYITSATTGTVTGTAVDTFFNGAWIAV